MIEARRSNKPTEFEHFLSGLYNSLEMSVKVHLYSSLQSYTGGQGTVEVNGNTVGQCLYDLVRRYPRLKPALFDKDGKLLPQVFVSINLNSARPEDLAKQVTDKDELYIILVIAGG